MSRISTKIFLGITPGISPRILPGIYQHISLSITSGIAPIVILGIHLMILLRNSRESFQGVFEWFSFKFLQVQTFSAIKKNSGKDFIIYSCYFFSTTCTLDPFNKMKAWIDLTAVIFHRDWMSISLPCFFSLQSLFSPLDQ